MGMGTTIAYTEDDGGVASGEELVLVPKPKSVQTQRIIVPGARQFRQFDEGVAAQQRGDYAEAVKWYRKAAGVMPVRRIILRSCTLRAKACRRTTPRR